MAAALAVLLARRAGLAAHGWERTVTSLAEPRWPVLAPLLALSAAAVVAAGRAIRRRRVAPPGARPAPTRRRPWRFVLATGVGRAAEAARWASRRDLAALAVRRPGDGRLVLGRSGRRLLAAEPRQSVLVVGPTQTMKTTGFAVPAILEWDGPVLATSVKTDLVRDTIGWRRRCGEVWVYDPTCCTGLPSDSWSPLAASGTWAGARRTAAAMVGAARSSTGGPSDAEFWYATAAKLLAPLLFAAAVSGRDMSDVVRWVDSQDTNEPAAALAMAGVEQAILAAEASWRREDRQRSSVFTTAETVLDPFADPAVAAAAGPGIDPAVLLDGGAHTLYLCAPSHEQRRLRPLFTSLVEQVVAAVYERHSAGRALDPPLLMVLDEAASIAPLEDLDGLAATGAGQGIQLVTVWQDLAQITARYGARAASVVNNHRAKVLLSGVSDPVTLQQLSGLVGDGQEASSSVTKDSGGALSTTESLATRPLAPADALRRIPPGHGLLLYGHLPPARLELRPWFEDRDLWSRRVDPG